ncbi:MAG: hypothetical protein OHK93_005448 [Ramalina farinacea]|uniref:Trichothecene 3-O-acetyltransferase n=1 Tax=Ramalina farinacea TaxID=258253 RepID=A0AA43QGR4_9LECA|nr:hypothetical protein [Ramalina farinacea]
MVDADFVKPAKPAPPQVVALSPADQNMPDVYICFLTLFPLSTSSDNQAVYSKLKAGLSLTLSEFPFIGGRLARDEAAAGERFQIQIDEHHGIKMIHRELKLSYPELKRNNFPCSAFDPEQTLPVPIRSTKPDPAVMAIQANFIHGGLILSICVHHRACDALSIGVVLKAWALHTVAAEMANGDVLGAAIGGLIPISTSRAPLCDGLIGARLQDFPEYRVLDNRKATPARPPPMLKSPLGPLKLCIVYISASHLADLKSVASGSNATDGCISTNDALRAFLWRHITRARSKVASALQQPGSSSSPSSSSSSSFTSQDRLNFAVAVEARRRMVPALPADYLGNAVFYCPVTSDLSTVASPAMPLSDVAKLIRDAVSGFDTAKIRGVLGLIDSLPRASDLMIRVYDDPMRGFVITSWADMGLYGLYWGVELGKVESVRAPNAVPPVGTPVCRVFPRLPNGALEISICLEEPAIEALREDEEFIAYAEWKGM